MTFHARLTELLEKARLESPYNNKAKDALKEFLVNHAEALRDVVVVAETHYKMRHFVSGRMLGEAIAKLEES